MRVMRAHLSVARLSASLGQLPELADLPGLSVELELYESDRLTGRISSCSGCSSSCLGDTGRGTGSGSLSEPVDPNSERVGE